MTHVLLRDLCTLIYTTFVWSHKKTKQKSKLLTFLLRKQTNLLQQWNFIYFQGDWEKYIWPWCIKLATVIFVKVIQFIQLTQIMMTNFSGSYQNLFKPHSNSGKFQKICHPILVKWITLTNQYILEILFWGVSSVPFGVPFRLPVLF